MVVKTSIMHGSYVTNGDVPKIGFWTHSKPTAGLIIRIHAHTHTHTHKSLIISCERLQYLFSFKIFFLITISFLSFTLASPRFSSDCSQLRMQRWTVACDNDNNKTFMSAQRGLYLCISLLKKADIEKLVVINVYFFLGFFFGGGGNLLGLDNSMSRFFFGGDKKKNNQSFVTSLSHNATVIIAHNGVYFAYKTQIGIL